MRTFATTPCEHGRKPIVCEACQGQPPEEFLYVIALIAEAKTHFLIAAQGTIEGSADRARTLGLLRRANEATRAYLLQIGGFEILPRSLMVEVRICELGFEKLSQPS